MQVQGSAHEHDPAVTAVIRSTDSTHIFVFDVVGEGNGRLARVGGLFSPNLQLPVHHDPLGGQFKILIVCKAQFAVDREMPCSAGGLTSRTTSLPFSMVTLSPATGTLRLGQVAGSDQRACLTAGDSAF